MKKLLFICLAVTLMNCSTEDDNNTTDNEDATLVGRWNLVGFEDTILYEFTEDKRFTMYSSDGTFETMQDLIDSGRPGNDWYYEGENVVIDLNFGNFSVLVPEFKCDNNVVEFINEDGEINSILFREAFDYSTCN